ncbi:LysR family transcriptional regulator, partial [Nocardiopsis listeri]|uniref:LysR family transcriptional regulator n=1 Tax=Nocardiopsis listeri TaxID=53440 RepID=UPI0016803EC2
MTPTQLRAFSTVVRLGSVKSAAQELCVSEAAVSLHIGKLRKLFDDRLFSRTSSGLTLIPGGLRLASRARPDASGNRSPHRWSSAPTPTAVPGPSNDDASCPQRRSSCSGGAWLLQVETRWEHRSEGGDGGGLPTGEEFGLVNRSAYVILLILGEPLVSPILCCPGWGRAVGRWGAS